MRPIKFRAWDKDEKSWIPSTELSIDGNGNVLTRDTDEWMMEVLDLEVMQFTGLLDKNGKEIYEGDVISRMRRCEVIFEKATFWAKDAGFALYLIAQTWEVIGNIHENPELLEEKK